MSLYADKKLLDATLKSLSGKDEAARVRATLKVKAHAEIAARDASIERFPKVVKFFECSLDYTPDRVAFSKALPICEKIPKVVKSQIDLCKLPIEHISMCDSRPQPERFHSVSLQRNLLLVLLWTCSVVSVISSQQVHSLPDLQAEATLPDSEMHALYELYYSTNGPNWIWLTGPSEGIPWNFTDPTKNNPCVDQWQGVTCTFPFPDEQCHVTELILSRNGMKGTIPESLSSLIRLNSLLLVNNQLTGTLPESLGNLTQLVNLNLGANQLTGTIPESLGNLTQLYELILDSNQLDGTIPAALGNLIQLEFLYLFYNQLTGTMPASLGNLTNLFDLILYFNHLAGTIPASLGNLAQVQTFYLYSNQLTGTIPASLGALTHIQELVLYSNELTGTIPASLGNLSQLYDLILYSNQLTGTIPASLGNMTQLQYLYLYSNQLSGSIPASLGNLTQIQYLDFDSNQLTGSIPIMLGKKLQQLQLNNNRLAGKIPSFASLNALKVLLLQNNRLIGNLDHVFNPTTQLQIETIVLNNNQLTGTLPAAMFQLQPQTFVGSSNCFEGPLPIAAICSNLNMSSFIADGISAATSCHNKLFISAYTLQHSLGGSIPICIFELPRIATLHLSGNGYTGSIPGNIVVSDTLTDLSLSHNTLTGTIPKHIQLRNWKNIDLSYNRLSGTLSSNFAANGSLELEENRLSGFIPASFTTMTNISVLGSNTFFCSYDQKDLPKNNPNRERYHCGSNSFDILYYVWLGACVCTAAVLGYTELKYGVVRKVLTGDSILLDTNLYLALFTVCRLSLLCAIYSIVVLLPLYTLCSLSYGTRVYEYAYKVSAVYMSGVVPFVLYWIFWLLLLILCAAMLLCTPATVNNIEQKKPAYHSVRQAMYILVPYLCIDCIVVVGVNAAYVYVVLYQSSSLLLLVQTLLSIFKIAWGRLALPYLLDVLSGYGRQGKLQVTTQIMVNMLNNIVIPCLVVAVVSPDCFYNAFVAAPEVTSTVYYQDCSVVRDTQCIQYDAIPVLTSFGPPFSYNYQCSSSLITYYSPAFVSMCIVNIFVTSLAQYVCQHLHRRATVGTRWHRLLSYCVPRLMKPFYEEASTPTRGYLGSNGLMTTLISSIGLVLTFGVTFPPLCLALVVSIFATVFGFRVHVSRYLASLSQQHQENVVELLRTECNQGDTMKLLKKSVWVLVTISCWFYTLFLFDILGDAVGFNGAYWVLIVMPLMPLVLYIVYSVICKHFVNEHNAEAVRDMEMQTLEDGNVHNILVVGTVSEGTISSTVAAASVEL